MKSFKLTYKGYIVDEINYRIAPLSSDEKKIEEANAEQVSMKTSSSYQMKNDFTMVMIRSDVQLRTSLMKKDFRQMACSIRFFYSMHLDKEYGNIIKGMSNDKRKEYANTILKEIRNNRKEEISNKICNIVSQITKVIGMEINIKHEEVEIKVPRG